MNTIKEKEKNINNEFFNYYFSYLNQSIMFRRLRDASDERNKDQVESTNKTLTKIKNIVKNVKNEKMIDIVKRILELNSKNQLGLGLKILTSNQMLSRLPIFLAQLKAGSNSEKRKNEIRQLLYSLYQSKKLTKNVYKSLVDII